MIVLFCSGHLNTFTVVPQEVPHEGITYYTILCSCVHRRNDNEYKRYPRDQDRCVCCN